jgi:CubicO group peptidase (beta-lactamase class C family)
MSRIRFPIVPVRRAALGVAIAFSIAALVPPVTAQVPPGAPAIAELRAGNDWDAAIDSARTVVRRMMREAGIPGASVAVGFDGDIVWSEGFGWADLEQEVPVTPETKFRAGSISKTMSASAVGLLMEAGLLDLDEEIQTYVPDFPRKRWPITLRQVAGHTAGIRHYRGDEFYSDEHYTTVSEGLTIFSADTLLFEPGTEYSYSSYGWNLVSAAVEGASGEEFLTFMRDRVFEPLGLRHTVPDYPRLIVPGRTAFYEQDEDGAVVNAPFVDNSYKWAGGGFLTTSEDLVRFGQAHMAPGFLDAATLREIQASGVLANGDSTNYGVGWSRRTDSDGDLTLGHSGGSVGGSTLLVLVPAHDLVVAGMINVSGPAVAMVRRVAAVFEEQAESREVSVR